MSDTYCWACGSPVPGLDPATAMCTGCKAGWYARRAAVPPLPDLIPRRRAVARTSEYAETTLDGCCGAGGAARGLSEAGHYVIGVDTNPRVRDAYLRSGAHEFHCASVLDVLADRSFMKRVTFTWNSPPCQHFSRMCRCRPELRAKYPDLITPSRPLLNAWGGPWAMENVYGAKNWMRAPVVLCMHGHFGREFYRHRLVEAGGGLVLTSPRRAASGQHRHEVPARVNRECGCVHPVPAAKAGHWKPGMFVSVAGHERKEPVRRVMEIDERWMPKREDVSEAIPPFMSHEIAVQLAAWRARAAA